ncbi:hypothetical protein [Amphritea sp.]|uniref:hypothetical protein n=1 Tax=Amphritea sp. TaxID=1872502 RepID=UPI003D0BCB9F
MKKNENDVLSRDESFTNAVFYFVQALDIATQSAVDQCEYFGDYNVAWELLDELSSINFLVNEFPENFTEDELVKLNEISKALAVIPDSLLVEAKTRKENLIALENPVWEPIRTQSLIAIEIFKKRSLE